MNCVVPNRPVGRVCEGIKLEVRMLRQHDRGSHFGRDGINDDIPFILGQGVGDSGLNTTRHVGRVGGVVDCVSD